jgi:hypothetical protein
VKWDISNQTLPGATRFVTPDEFRAGVPARLRRSVVTSVVIDALAAAADDTGVITAFSEVQFYETHIAGVFEADRRPGETVYQLVFDRFSALALSETVDTLFVVEKLLAIRENGNTVDYRLMLPA